MAILYVCTISAAEKLKEQFTLSNFQLSVEFDFSRFVGILSYNWFMRYLSNRLFGEFNETSFSLQLIKCGSPQDSILGPLLFLIFVMLKYMKRSS